MVWFSEETLPLTAVCTHYLENLKSVPLDETVMTVERTLAVQQQCYDVIAKHFAEDGLVLRALDYTMGRTHIMEPTRLRLFTAMISILNKGINDILEFNSTHDFGVSASVLESFVTNRLVFALLWGFGGSMNLAERCELGKVLSVLATTAQLPPDAATSLVQFLPHLPG